MSSKESLLPQHAAISCFEEEPEMEAIDRMNHQRNQLLWPPPQDDTRCTPTATPLYVAPPETQHVIVKTLDDKSYHQTMQQCDESEMVDRKTSQQSHTARLPHWQTQSAPQLTNNHGQHIEFESGSDGYTSTSTTTTTTTDEYQRMYAAQVQCYQMQQLYDYDYNIDLMQRQRDHIDYTSENPSGRRSAQECIDMLIPSISTQKLVDIIREVTPSPIPSKHQNINHIMEKHVAFSDEAHIKEVECNNHDVSMHETEKNTEIQDNQTINEQQLQQNDLQQCSCDTEEAKVAEEKANEIEDENMKDKSEREHDEDNGGKLIVEERSQILESERLFQPTPEIKIEIPPVRQIPPPSKIPNPVPKQWINPMVAVLTTAPDKPYHMINCLPSMPGDEVYKCEGDIEEKPKNTERLVPAASDDNSAILRENPPKGSRFSKAITTAPDFPMLFEPPLSQGVPLPEETEPYMPPPIDQKPYLREDYRPKSPFLSALTVTPDKPFEAHFERDVPIHVLDLPTPTQHLTMTDALRTAPEVPYTPLNSENATQQNEEKQNEQQRKKYEFQVLDREAELGLTQEPVEYFYTTDKQSKTSAFAAKQAFLPSQEPLSSNTTQKYTYNEEQSDLEFQNYVTAHERYHKRRDYFTQKEQELLQQRDQQQFTVTPYQTNQTNPTNQSEMTVLKSFDNRNASFTRNASLTTQNLPNNTITTTANIPTNLTQTVQKTLYSNVCNQEAMISTKYNNHEIVEETVHDLEQSDVLFPPPSPLSHTKTKHVQSGLHRPETIPKYQRNWTILPTQSPVRTPEPHELRENVPLAFVDTPKTPRNALDNVTNAVHKPIPQLMTYTSSSIMPSNISGPFKTTTTATIAATITTITTTTTATATSIVPNYQQTIASEQVPQYNPTKTLTATSEIIKKPQQRQHHHHQQSQQPYQDSGPINSVPIIIKNNLDNRPITMAFQSLDEVMEYKDKSQTPVNPYVVPSSFTQKPVPVIPSYQTAEKLCFEECPPTHEKPYNSRSITPRLSRERSPAPGPPPNPMAMIRAPRLRENELSSASPTMLPVGSITTGQSYLSAQHQAKNQNKILTHNETTTQSSKQNYLEKPEHYEERQIGNLTIQKKEKGSHLEEQKQSHMESHTKTQMGNIQIEQKRKVIEEFEHTSSAKTIEIRTGSSTNEVTNYTNGKINEGCHQNFGKTGFVANQAKRLSNLEEEISNLSSQSKAISAKAATLIESTKLPETSLKNFGCESKASNFITMDNSTKIIENHNGFSTIQQQQQQQGHTLLSLSSISTATTTTSSSSTLSSSTTTACLNNVSFSLCSSQKLQQQQQKQANNIVSCCLKKASITNQAYATTAMAVTNPNLNANVQTQKLCPAIVTATTTSTATTTTATELSTLTGAGAQSYNPSDACSYKQQQQQNEHQQQQQSQSQSHQSFYNKHHNNHNNISNHNNSNNNNNNSNNNNNNNNDIGLTTTTTANYKQMQASATATATAAVTASQQLGALTSAANLPFNPIQMNLDSNVGSGSTGGGILPPKGGVFGATTAPKRGRGIMNKAVSPGARIPLCNSCNTQIRGPFITALGRIWCPEHFICVNANCRRPLQDIGFVEEKGDLYCEYCFEKYLAPTCNKCANKIKGDCLNAIGKHFHPECFSCAHCGKLFGNTPFFLEDGEPYCEADWNELFTTKCYACGFPVEAGDRWVEALNHNYHSQCFNCTFCKQNLEGQSFYNKGGRPFCKNHAR